MKNTDVNLPPVQHEVGQFLENNNKEYAFDKKRFWITQLIISKVKLQLNTNYVYVGEYIKNTGDKAPVFLHRLTGKIIYC